MGFVILRIKQTDPADWFQYPVPDAINECRSPAIYKKKLILPTAHVTMFPYHEENHNRYPSVEKLILKPKLCILHTYSRYGYPTF